jgi:S-DNA-T family DNA segregation ATPase FtsK/SpoIIIE
MQGAHFGGSMVCGIIIPMAKKKTGDLGKKFHFWDNLRDETIQAILSIFSFLVALISLLASFHHSDGSDLAGLIGGYGFDFLNRAFGIGYFLIPIVFAVLGIAFLRGVERRFDKTKAIGAFVFFLSGLGLIYLIPTNVPNHLGGVIGRWIGAPLVKVMDVWATTLVLLALFITSLVVMFEWRIAWEGLTFRKKDKREKDKEPAMEMDEDEEATVEEAVAAAELDGKKLGGEAKKKAKQKKLDFTDDEEENFASSVIVPHLAPFTPPPLSLLERDRGKPETGDIKGNANIIKRTLQNFGITVEMDEVSIGPSVTRYALKPAEGVKLSRIVALNNNLSLALAAHPIRIEAPIPGKSLVGIEVPNTAKTTVGLATLLASADYQESEKPLLVSLGKDIAGRAHFANLGKAPHILIAGATGSGKSVTIHAFIASLLYRNSPENLKFIMIDPKRVELTLYNRTPHLLTPVITDPKKAILALKWAAKEMSRRYDVLEKSAARDVESYHKNVLSPALAKLKKGRSGASGGLPETLPYIVIVIDELADIMQTYPRELESAVVRLAQMSRAVGIHLVISTQRPSVNIITGLIKVNIPSRVALQVASQIDSRTILDQSGAEKLLGAGDMLYLGAEMSKPVRLQSAFISESEVKRVVKYLADQYKDEVMGEISLTMPEAGSGAAFDSMNGLSGALDGDSFDEEDEMYEPAREAVLTAGKASTSYIQRKLGVGYSRAAKLMDMLEERGVIGPANGSKPREVIGAGAGIEKEGAGDEKDG